MAISKADATTSTRTKAKTHPVTPSLARIPDKAILQTYVTRMIEGTPEFTVFGYHDAQNDNVLIEGPTGLGKTLSVMAYAASTEKPFYAIPSNVGIEPSQLFGKYVPDGKGGFIWVDGPVTHVVRHGGVLLVNEVNFLPERVATVIFGLLDHRRQIMLLDHKGEVIDAHPDLMIFADMNPDYEGTRPLNKAFRNRFAAQMYWDYDPNIEKKLVGSERLLELAKKIRSQVATGLIETPLSTNMLVEFERIATGMSFDYAVSNLITHFDKDERASVKQVIETMSVELRNQVGSRPLTQEELDEKRIAMKYGDVDEEWGVKGVDWIWQDEKDEVADDDDFIED